MPTIGEDRELLQISILRGCRKKYDQLIHEMKVKYPEARKFCQDRGTFLDWLLDRTWIIKEESEKSTVRLAELKKKEEELVEYENKLNQKNRQLTEIDGKLCEQLGLLPFAKDLLLELTGSKIVSKDEILTTLKTLKEAGINFAEVVQVIQREDLPGFLAWAKRIKKECLRAAEALKQTWEDVEAHKLALKQLQEAEKELAGKVQVRLNELDRSSLAVAQACAAARDVGLYTDYVRQMCQTQNAEKIQNLLPSPALVIAGTILEAVTAAYGDQEITIVPGPKHLLPVHVTFRELSRSLAPVEAYREQQKAQLRMETKAEVIAAG